MESSHLTPWSPALPANPLKRYAGACCGCGEDEGGSQKKLKTTGDTVIDALREIAKGTLAQGHSLLGALSQLGGSVFGMIGRTLTAGFAAVGAVIGAFVSVIKQAVASATEYAKTLSTLHANNGISFNQGYKLTAQNSVFGISPERTAAIYGDSAQNPLLFGQRASALGMPSFNESDFFAKLARVYRSQASQGPYGRMMANSRLDALYGGRAPDEVRQIVNLSPAKIQGQIEYGKKIQSEFGITGETLRKFSEDIPLATQRIGFAFEQARLKIAVLLAPFIEKTFGGIATYIGKNADKIAGAIKTGVTWLVQELPVYLLKGGAFILRGASIILRGVAWLAQGVADNGALLLQIFQTLLTGITNFVQGVANLIGPGSWIGKNVLAPIGSQVTGQPNGTPGQQAANTAAGATVVNYALSPATAAAGWAATAWKARATAKAAAQAATNAATGGTAPSPATAVSWWTRAGRAVKWLRNTPTLGISWTGLRAAAAAAPGTIFGAGLAVGTLGYEALRKFGVAQGASTFQIVRYYANRAGGASAEDAALRAYGVDPDAAREVQRKRHLGAAQAAAGVAPQQNIITTLAQPLANAANSGAKTLADLSNEAGSMANKYQADILQELKGIRESSEGVKNAILDKNGQPIILGRDIVNKIGAYIAEDTVRLARRGGR